MKVRAEVVMRGATAIRDGFLSFRSEFRAITRQARDRFEHCDWTQVQEDARRRLNLYPEVVQRVVTIVRDMLGERIADQEIWGGMKRSYARLVQGETDRELAETFYNSITRCIFSTAGVNPDIEFVAPRREDEIESPDPGCYRRYESDGDTLALVRRILKDYAFRTRFKDPDSDSALVAREIGAYLSTILGSDRIDAVETLHPVFFRQKAAYVVGRLRVRHQVIPIVLAMLNSGDGVSIDAVLMAEAEVSILFSFARTHFHVEVDYPRDLVLFLKSILPLKPIAEIYISLGFTKHGKTELYRGLRRHLDVSRERFVFAKGDEGMVMLVFTLPFYDVVFKVIKDRFAYPKATNRQQVMDRYRLVFRWDRVGRLVEAQEFEHLKFRRELFTPEVLEALTTEAADTVTVNDDHVIIHHVYTERKVTPLNVYLRQVAADAARRAVIDYGRTIKELAAANVFPGDFLLKNFGVTRHGRVVFYDYDELCLVTDCNFRKMPPARTPEDELAPEPWFAVGEDDVFPEEFERFLGLPAPLREVFRKHHGDVFSADFWQRLKERHLAGEILDFYPYSPTKRLQHQGAGDPREESVESRAGRKRGGGGLQVLPGVSDEYREILDSEALAFVEVLVREFAPRIEALLARRVARQQEIDAGAMLDFLPETAIVRDAAWSVAPIPDDLRDRRVEVNGPVRRKTIIDAMSSGANVFMADLEDANSPTWPNVVGGQIRLKEAVRRTIVHAGPNGERHALPDDVAVLMVCPRGLHHVEKHVQLNGESIPAALFDFGLYLFHNGKDLLRRGSGPYYYLPKLESHLEARMWNDVFRRAQDELDIPQGSIRATVLIENVAAAFEMDEILYELRDHSAGLNCGRFDYIFSIINKFHKRPEFVLPDRAQLSMTTHCMRSYSLLAVQTCHRRGIHAIGGLAAQVPIENDLVANEAALQMVRDDKVREAMDGHDGTWVAHPGMVEVARQAFEDTMPQPNQIHRKREEVHIHATDLLDVPEGEITEQGLRHNIDIAIQYMEAWLRGDGYVPIYDFMEDAATAELSRSQVWQWLRHDNAVLADGRPIDRALCSTLFDEELQKLERRVGAERFESGKFRLARRLIERIVTDDEFTDFMTLVGYEYLD